MSVWLIAPTQRLGAHDLIETGEKTEEKRDSRRK